MEKKQLGRTGLEVSIIGFGGAPLGLQGYLSGEDRCSASFERAATTAIRLAVERGVNLFDTAPAYGDGRSEQIIGGALEPHREEVILATKFHRWPQGDPAELEAILDGSLRRLRTDRVDLLQVHGNHFTAEHERLLLHSPVREWMERERERGRCRFLGITAEGGSGALERLLESGLFDTLQISYNLLCQSLCDHRFEPTGIVPLAKGLGLGVLTMRTATSGFLQNLLTREFPELSADALTALAIRFVLSTPEVDCALIGMRTEREVLINVELAEDPSNRLDLEALNDRYSLDLDALRG